MRVEVPRDRGTVEGRAAALPHGDECPACALVHHLPLPIGVGWTRDRLRAACVPFAWHGRGPGIYVDAVTVLISHYVWVTYASAPFRHADAVTAAYATRVAHGPVFCAALALGGSAALGDMVERFARAAGVHP